MAGVQITAQIIGLEEELQAELKKIERQIPYALTNTGVEMARDLQSTLHRVWYKGYTPAVYERRTDDPNLGTPIGSDENFDISTDVATKVLNFIFEPDGDNAKFETMRGGDKLIEWIQKEHKYGEIRHGKVVSREATTTIPARPFWNIFLEEQSRGGIIEKFIKGMSPYQVIAGSEDSAIDLTEFELPAGGTFEESELPF